ncbi:MAG: PspC domain-containing protein [Bdellovibrionales bacterium]
MKWVRSQNGMILGVCRGIAQNLDIPVGLFRFVWIVSLLFFGVGLWLYLILAISLPREDKQIEALDAKVFGVCSRVALRTDLEVGVVRFIAICLSILSLGATIVGYIVLHFVLDRPEKDQASASRPTTPPATT